MPASARNLPLKLHLHPTVAERFRPYAARLGLTGPGLLAALVWNDSLAPAQLLRPTRDRRLSRVAVPCSLRAPIRRLATAAARRRRLPLNAYLEALLYTHLMPGERELIIRLGPR